LNLPGVHNVQNALAAIAVGMEIGAPDEAIVKALAEFRGVGGAFSATATSGWRKEFHFNRRLRPSPGRDVRDDCGGARAFPDRRLVLAFQPHRYTRTRDCFEDFVKVLSSVDALLLTEVYPAGEAPIVAADGRALARAVRVAGKVEPIFVEQIAELPAAILALATGGDVVITMGAGQSGRCLEKMAKGN